MGFADRHKKDQAPTTTNAKALAGQPAASAPKASRQNQVKEAYQEVLGREADPGGLREYSKYGDMNKVKRLLAMSQEGRERGVDAVQYGATYADPGNMSIENRQYYDTFARHRSGPIYDDEVNNWAKYSGTPKALEATLRGGIVNVTEAREGGGHNFFKFVNEEGLAILGDDIHKLSGANKNEVWIMPRGTKFKASNFAQVKHTGPEKEYTVWAATGNPTDGLLGAVDDALGTDFMDWIPHEFFLAADLTSLGFGSSQLAGSEGKRYASETLGNITGMSDANAAKTLGEISEVQRVAAQIAATATGVGAPVAVAMQGMRGVEQHNMGQDVDWGQVAAYAGMAAITGGNPFVDAAVNAGYSALNNGNTEDNLVAAGAGFLGGLGNDLVSAVSNAGASYYRNEDASGALMAGAGTFMTKSPGRGVRLMGGALSALADGELQPWDLHQLQAGLSKPKAKRDETGAVVMGSDGNPVPAGHSYSMMSPEEMLKSFKSISTIGQVTRARFTPSVDGVRSSEDYAALSDANKKRSDALNNWRNAR